MNTPLAPCALQKICASFSLAISPIFNKALPLIAWMKWPISGSSLQHDLYPCLFPHLYPSLFCRFSWFAKLPKYKRECL